MTKIDAKRRAYLVTSLLIQSWFDSDGDLPELSIKDRDKVVQQLKIFMGDLDWKARPDNERNKESVK